MLSTAAICALPWMLNVVNAQYPYPLYVYQEERFSPNQTDQADRIREVVASQALKGVEVKLMSRWMLSPPIQAVGNSLLPGGRMGIIIDSKNGLDVGWKFLGGHELAHIKNNDMLKMPLVGMVVSVATGLILYGFFPSCRKEIVFGKGPFWAISTGTASQHLGRLAGILVFLWYSKQCELKADADSLKHCSEGEKVEALQFFLSMFIHWEYNSDTSTSSYKEKENALDIWHPPLYQRALQVWRSLENPTVEAVQAKFVCTEEWEGIKFYSGLLLEAYVSTLERLAREGNAF